ncbi:MAG: hypothetical protein KBD29_02575 [Candidatus Magasanikbacteria bacterium]|nr:hypothetical protein [Candidatus Magasanikbacteria bacterium]
MKKITFVVALLSVNVLIGTGCQKQEENLEEALVVPMVVTELQNQVAPETEKEKNVDRVEVSELNSSLYRGYYFDIEYPSDFVPSPLSPTTMYEGVEYKQTDEALFLSPDESVEFFVFSPLWAGEPTYLKILATEEIVDEKIEESDSNYGKRMVRWVTVRAKDSSYYRSFISIKERGDDGSEVHHVFGIRYKDSQSYERYKEAYVSFKESLRQYAD